MARDQTARYPSAKDMADELRRFSAGQLLRSREYTVRELARRWVRRHRAAVSVAAIALAVLAVVAITSVREIVRRRDQAELAVAHGRLEQGRQLLVAGDPSHAAPHLAAAALALPDDPIARRLARLALRDADRRLATLRGTAIAFSPDGATLVVGRDDGAVQLVDASSGRALRLLPAHGGKITRVAYAGGMLVTASRTGAFMRNPMSGDAVELARDAVNDVIVVGDRVAIASDTGIQLGGLDGANLVRAPLAGAGSLDVSPDGSRLLALSKTETAVWSLPALTRIATLPARWWGRFDRDGSVVLGDSNVLERFASSGAPVVLLHGQVQPIERLSGDELATANLRIDTASNTTRVLVPEGATHSVSIDPTHLVTAGFDGALRVWDLDRSAQPIAVLAAADSTTGLVIDASHTRLAALGGHATVELWDVQRLPAPVVAAHADAELGALIAHSGRIAGWLNGHGVDRAAVLADPLHPVPGWLGELTATEMLVGTGGQIVAINVRDANQRREFRDDASIDHVAVSASGAVLATDAAGRITLRTLRTAAIVDRFDTGFRDITAVAVDDSDHVVTGHDDGTIRIWTVGLRTATVLRGHTAHVEMLALRRDRLLSGSWDSTTRAWAFPAGEARGIVLSNAHGPVVVSPDGRWLATVERAGLVDIWDSSGGRLIERIATSGVPASTAFVDDDHLAVGSESGVLELFDISAPTRSDAELARVTN
jgi:WD40 repeat protein